MAGYTGAQAAQEVLRISGIYDVRIERVAGELTDHYDPRAKVLRLSDSTYGSNSVAAVCVAAHECGHAIQHQKDMDLWYFEAHWFRQQHRFQSFLADFCCRLIFSMRPLLMLGILLFGLAVIFQLVTLPVEFNASSRAIRILEGNGMLGESEITGAKKVLRAAAMTYVASLASSILQLLRLVILAGGNRRDD